MNLRALGTLAYVVGFLVKTTPKRRQLRRLRETEPERSAAIACGEVQKALRNMVRISGVRIETIGLENIPEEACLFVGNHTSYFDVITTGAVIPGCPGYVAKDSLEKIPMLSAWMDLIHCLFLNRSDIKQGLKTINQGADFLREGYSMFIFPEGTRGKNGVLGEFKGGSLKMAQKANAPIVPVAISGTADIFENNKNLSVRPGTVRISFGEPFRIAELPKEQKRAAAAYTKSLIEGMLSEQKCLETACG